jgi:hypothetical protein
MELTPAINVRQPFRAYAHNPENAMQSVSSYRKPVSNKSYGIEIECILPSNAAPEPYAYQGFWFVITDASINSEYDMRGREFVSQPLPADWLCNEIYKLAKKYEWTHNDSCGIHVHVSRKWFSDKKARAVHAFIERLSEDDYSLLFGRVPNYYCMRGAAYNSERRYVPVNTQNKNTIELRMFSSGSGKWAAYCVHMAEYLVSNALHLTVHGCFAIKDLYYKE